MNDINKVSDRFVVGRQYIAKKGHAGDVQYEVYQSQAGPNRTIRGMSNLVAGEKITCVGHGIGYGDSIPIFWIAGKTRALSPLSYMWLEEAPEDPYWKTADGIEQTQ